MDLLDVPPPKLVSPKEYAEILLGEEEAKIRAKVMALVAKDLKVSVNTINSHWGSAGVDFPKTPERAKLYLAYALNSKCLWLYRQSLADQKLGNTRI